MEMLRIEWNYRSLGMKLSEIPGGGEMVRKVVNSGQLVSVADMSADSEDLEMGSAEEAGSAVCRFMC